MTITQVFQAAKKLKSFSQVGDIVQGALNSISGANGDLAEERMNVCRACPLHNNGVCDSTKRTIKVSVTPGDNNVGNEVSGCGCNLPWKVTIPNQFCPAGKWLPKSEKEFYSSEEVHPDGIFVISKFFASPGGVFYELDNCRNALGSQQMMDFYANNINFPIVNSPSFDFINVKLKNFVGPTINMGEWMYRATRTYSPNEKANIVVKGSNFMIAPLQDVTISCSLYNGLELKKGNLYTFVPEISITGLADTHYLFKKII